MISEGVGRIFTFNDMCAGVKLNGDVEWGSVLLFPGWRTFGGSYRSTNPTSPGDGSWLVCVKDRGEGINEYGDGDEIKIMLFPGGALGEYFNQGYVQGNIQVHD